MMRPLMMRPLMMRPLMMRPLPLTLGDDPVWEPDARHPQQGCGRIGGTKNGCDVYDGRWVLCMTCLSDITWRGGFKAFPFRVG